MKMVEDYYSLLGLSPDATATQVKEAYRYKVNILHPDRLGQMPEQVRHRAEEELKKINKAYEILSDSGRRQRYDASYSAAKAEAEIGGGERTRPTP